jgi:hypothetical protein
VKSPKKDVDTLKGEIVEAEKILKRKSNFSFNNFIILFQTYQKNVFLSYDNPYDIQQICAFYNSM